MGGSCKRRSFGRLFGFCLAAKLQGTKGLRLLGTDQGNVLGRTAAKLRSYAPWGRTISPSLITRSPKALRSLWTPGMDVPRPARAATLAERWRGRTKWSLIYAQLFSFWLTAVSREADTQEIPSPYSSTKPPGYQMSLLLAHSICTCVRLSAIK